jgi:hypothetical protein
VHHVEVALDGDGWLTPAAIEQRNGGSDSFFGRTERIDKGRDCLGRVLTSDCLNALGASGGIAGLAFLERPADDAIRSGWHTASALL